MATVRRCAFLTALLLLAAGDTARPVGADSIALVEQKIKAGLLYNFLKYTQWPPAPANAGMNVCLLGGDPFDGHLSPMAGRTVNERAIAVREIDDAKEGPDCSMMVVHADQKASWPLWRKALSGRDVLTVSDFDGFVAQGGMIEFAHVDNRIGVKINVDAVGATHLKVEDRLLKLATVVHASEHGP